VKYLLQIEKAEEKTSGGLFLTQATKEKPSFGTVSFHVLSFFFV
jgi:chaperonin GroES